MKTNLNRRQFIKKGSKTGIACCAFMMGTKFKAFSSFSSFDDPSEIPNPKELCYCGYKCPDDCEFYVASVENNLEKKKQVFEKWGLEERYNLKFDEESIFCFKCKPEEDYPEGPVLTNCTVRQCAMEKELQCCIECDELTTCEKDLWIRFPDFKKAVIEMQKKYLEA